jgi:hypothetical protein
VISADLADLIDSVLPVREYGVVGLPLGPYASAWVSSTPTIIAELKSRSGDQRAETAAVSASSKARKSTGVLASSTTGTRLTTVVKIGQSKAVLSLLRARPGSTARDLAMVLKTRGIDVNGNWVERVLRRLEARGTVRGCRLSGRDAKRAGGSVLWEAA